MSALSHVVEVDDETNGPLASVMAVAALRRSAAALGIDLAEEPRTTWSAKDPFDPAAVDHVTRRFVTATARVEAQ